MSYEQDLKTHEIKEAKFNQWYEKTKQKLSKQSSTIDGFLQDFYSEISDEDMELLQESLNYACQINANTVYLILTKYYKKYLDWLVQNEADNYEG